MYHIAKGHAFLDGNKRTAYVTALYFLGINGIHIPRPEDVLVLATAVVDAAESDTLEKTPRAALMRSLGSPMRKDAGTAE